MADKCTNLLSPGPQGKAYIKNWSKLCCYETPTTTYEEFVQQVDEEYTASCTKDKLFYDYSTKLFQQCFSGGSGGMTSFTVEGDNGTPFTITNGETLDFEGSTGIDIGVSDPKVLVAIDYSGVDSFIMAAANGTSITVDGANDKLVIYDNDAAAVKYINANQLPGGGGTTEVYWSANTNGTISNSGLTDTKVGIGTDKPNEELTVVGEISGTSNLHIGGDTYVASDVYTDQLRRFTDNSTTTKINLSSGNIIKLFAGNSSNERVKISSSEVLMSGITRMENSRINGNLGVTGNTSVSGDILQPGVNSIFNNGNYLEVGTGFANAAQLTFNANHDGGVSTNTYTPVFAGNANAGMTVIKMPSGGHGGLEFYVKNHGTTSGSQNLSTFTKILDLNQDGDSTFSGRILVETIDAAGASYSNDKILVAQSNGEVEYLTKEQLRQDISAGYWSGNTDGTISNSGLTQTNVGVGTDKPNEELTVVGTISATTNVKIGTTANHLTVSNQYIRHKNSNRIFFSSAPSTSAPNLLYDYWGMPDNDHFYWGTDEDLDIYHSGSQGYIDNDTGTLNILSSTVKIGDTTSETIVNDNLQVNDDLTVNTDNLYVDSNNGKTGVKTLAPDAILTVSGCTGAGGSWTTWTPSDALTSFALIEDNLFASYAPADADVPTPLTQQGTTIRLLVGGVAYYGTTAEVGGTGNYGWSSGRAYFTPVWTQSSVTITDADPLSVVVAYGGPLPCEEPLFKVWKGQTPAFQVSATTNTPGFEVMSGSTNMLDVMRTHDSYVTGATFSSPILTLSRNQGLPDITTSLYNNTTNLFWTGNSTNIVNSGLTTTKVGIGTDTPSALFEVKDLIKFPGSNGDLFIGDSAGANWESGSQSNTALGKLAMGLGTMNSALQNTAIGFASLSYITTGDLNTAVGIQASQALDTGNYNTSLGATALFGGTYHSYNTAIGAQAMYFTTNGALGKSVITDTHNTAVGYHSQYYNLDGAYNTSVGSQSIGSNTIAMAGTGSTAMGYKSLFNNTTGNYNTALGYQAGDNITTGDYNISIGADADLPSATGNYQLNIGNIIYGQDANTDGAISQIGIGTDSPTSKLHISTADNVIVKIVSTDSIATVELADNSTSNQAILTRVANDLKICKDGGNVGLPISPKTKLDVQHDPTSLSNNTGGGESVTFGTEDGTDTLTAGKLMYLNSSGVWKYADASAASTSTNLLAIALGTAVSDGLLIRGFFDFTSVEGAFAKGAPVYVSESSGAVDFTAPSTSGDIIRIIGHATDTANVIYFNPDGTWVELT